MEVSIRPMAERDTPAVAQIVAGAYTFLAAQEGYSQEQLNRLYDRCTAASVRDGWLRRWTCFVAEFEDNIVGAVAISGNEIAEFWVSTEHHRQGIGTALFRTAERFIREAGHTMLVLCCAARGARPFYERMGIEVVDTKPCPFGPLEGWPITHYRKDL